MSESSAEVYIDLTEIGPDLIIDRGGRAWGEFANALVDEINVSFRNAKDNSLKVRAQTTDTRPASSKNPAAGMAVGGILISMLAGAGYSITPEKATHLLKDVWQALKKLLPKNTHVKITSGNITIDIDADSGDSARFLLQAGAEVVSTLSTKQENRQDKGKRAVTLKPRKR